jgi:hypothetical protein
VGAWILKRPAAFYRNDYSTVKTHTSSCIGTPVVAWNLPQGQDSGKRVGGCYLLYCWPKIRQSAVIKSTLYDTEGGILLDNSV